MWFIFPSVILLIGSLGLYLTIKAYKKGQTISLKKLIVTVMLIFLGGGVFLQKMRIVDNEHLEQLLLAFDKEAREEIEKESKRKKNEAEEKRKEMFKRIGRETKKLNKN
ncbi:hypothetical protein ACFSTE_04335 [Aquimarina hainanensis]|uniref:Uncharacterized protein n=1 Tax=Aquimarina hainanensis TaxID=1578017 RepID=A0ABW5N349_9FLAO|nr:hypothetical protein [Aquimarina sp. TRL1]QKX06065.1 hypothetical protein HN014_14495 [Aquimarina sp. TRL1]